ncbi:MAG TPA: DUF3311 domain-containing protein [Rhizomicrobium sp.]|jgi:hypothetical protein|nr:DUF3311 domain-containing protein [Rhizomicrobium sp.]
MDKPAPKRRFRLSYLLLLIPYVAMMWVPLYNRTTPEIAGIPFFYWYQMAWIVIGALLLLPAYYAVTRGDGR